MRLWPKLGPGLLVTAAFIGPGTVTTASKAGASAGYGLLWVVILATLSAIVLQEMAARLGIVSRKSLSEASMTMSGNRGVVSSILRGLIGLLILAAIAYGNAAYQTGNLTGAAEGVSVLLGQTDESFSTIGSRYVIALSLVAGAILWSGEYRWIERILIGLVVLMSGLFVASAVLGRPDPGRIAEGLIKPTFQASQLTNVLALIGTTVVPYNLFLHTQAVQERWKQGDPQAVKEARWDTVISVAIGGLITMAVVITAAVAFEDSPQQQGMSFLEMSRLIEPSAGVHARWLFGLGLLAAGLTSSITAPLAAALATSGVLGWDRHQHPWRFRSIWLTVLFVGAAAAFLGSARPSEVIVAAQVANGILLPVIAILLIVAANRSSLMGTYRNRWIANLSGFVVVASVSALSIYKLIQLFS